MREISQVPDQAEPEVAAVGQRGSAIMLAAMGVVWWYVGAGNLKDIALLVQAAGIAQVVALVVVSVRTLGTEGSAELFQRNRRMYNRVNAIQYGAIAAVVIACIVTKSPAWIMPPVTIIVGLHFLALAPAFRQPAFRWQGFALIALGVVGGVLAATATAIETIVAVGGLGAATVLWAGAWFLVLTGPRRAIQHAHTGLQT